MIHSILHPSPHSKALTFCSLNWHIFSTYSRVTWFLPQISTKSPIFQFNIRIWKWSKWISCTDVKPAGPKVLDLQRTTWVDRSVYFHCFASSKSNLPTNKLLLSTLSLLYKALHINFQFTNPIQGFFALSLFAFFLKACIKALSSFLVAR